MKMTPDVSVILPTYNRAGLLPRAIASVLGQSYGNFELIVVDDGSIDGTAELMRRYRDPRVVYLPAGRNLGDAGARNRGIAQARAPWLAFQDSDDEWLPEKLDAQLAVARDAAPDCAAVACAMLRQTPDQVQTITWPKARQGSPAPLDVTAFVGSLRAYLQTLLLRRSAFQELGGFDTALHARSDIDFCLRLVERYQITVMDQLGVLSMETGNSISNDAGRRRTDIRQILECRRGMIERDREAASRVWYQLARAELVANRRAASLRALLAAIRRSPLRLRNYLLALLIPAGAAGLTAGGRFRVQCGRAMARLGLAG